MGARAQGRGIDMKHIVIVLGVSLLCLGCELGITPPPLEPAGEDFRGVSSVSMEELARYEGALLVTERVVQSDCPQFEVGDEHVLFGTVDMSNSAVTLDILGYPTLVSGVDHNGYAGDLTGFQELMDSEFVACDVNGEANIDDTLITGTLTEALTREDGTSCSSRTVFSMPR